ncbi:hypothetical protein N1851_015637 [Merluccius polli]|uniref:Uncharacterized protein n=1 Tax=Merluccius polli TaxID=89951 RepID=A0AA47MSS0_MERPO|nr:hypothetical protein N1851_015637 [Merluccius polli]
MFYLVPLFSSTCNSAVPYGICLINTGAFEHWVENNASNKGDCLYFLDKYTRGQSKELVRSCQHMAPDRGYTTAKQLLEEHFGNEHKITAAYMDRFHHRAQFADIVSFIEHQVRIVSDPIFGDIQNTQLTAVSQKVNTTKSQPKPRFIRDSFATTVTTIETPASEKSKCSNQVKYSTCKDHPHLRVLQ